MSRQVTRQVFDAAEQLARLDVGEDRADLVRGALETAYALIDTLDELDLGETPPATAFNARWE
jgi:Asp-tRNA(Asn)/Glu-tRNA(Gln) amidotransferase C subunit